jgi:hypothetical protein
MNVADAGRLLTGATVSRRQVGEKSGTLPGTGFFGNLFVRVSAAQAGIRARKGRQAERG